MTSVISLSDMTGREQSGQMRRVLDASTLTVGQTVYGHHTTSGAEDPRDWSEYVPMRVVRTWRNAVRLEALADGTACRLLGHGPGNWLLDSDEVFAEVIG